MPIRSIPAPALVKSLLSIAGLGVSAYLTYSHYSNTALVCAGGSHGCDLVNMSPYAEVGGVYVAVFGLVGYAALLVLARVETHVNASLRGSLRQLFFGVALMGFLYSAYLTAIELFVLHAICQWCAASALIMTVLLALSIFDLRRA